MGILDDITKAGNSFVGVSNTLGINGFVFDIADEARISLESEITDHYVEDGTTVQDHIALRPERVTLRGLIGEFVYRPEGGKSILQNVSEKLTIITSYLPTLSKAGTQIYNKFASIDFEKKQEGTGTLDTLIDIGGDAWNAYRNINIPQDNQSQAFIYFEALRNARKLLTVQTPYRYYTDMAIETIKATQNGRTRDESDFEVTLKKIRKVQVTTKSQLDVAKKNAQRLAKMKFETVKKGLIDGITAGVSSYWDSAVDKFNSYLPKKQDSKGGN